MPGTPCTERGRAKSQNHPSSEDTDALLNHGGKPTVSWADFIETHKEIITACDFFTVEVLTAAGLVTVYVLFFIKIATRELHIAGITTNPDLSWMAQIAHNITMTDIGFLEGQRHLILDRDPKFSEQFCRIIRDTGTKIVRLPPDLNAYAERFVHSIKEECLSRLVFFGIDGLRRAVREYAAHYHEVH
ncbi:hypothetical protein KJ940_17075 [Myxococcota bacterium]|nr:hypothetical protein [Myxococcota bacterium]